MRFLKIPFLLIWRVWFYVLMFSSILIMLPFLLILTSDEKYYATFWKMVRAWSFVLIYGMGFRLKIEVEEKIDPNKSYMFCPNHTSMMDPFVLISMVKSPIVFVGKAELKKIPVFGFFYKRICILVDRSNPKSRKEVYFKAKRRLQNGTCVAIFPEGLVPTEDVVLSPFKNGAFSLAIEHQIPIVPATYFDCKRLFSWTYFKGGPGTFRIKQHHFISTKGLAKEDLSKVKEETYQVIYNELVNDEAYMKDTNRNE